jgi:hypothetical protein
MKAVFPFVLTLTVWITFGAALGYGVAYFEAVSHAEPLEFRSTFNIAFGCVVGLVTALIRISKGYFIFNSN